jgi:TonB-dependent SusC/RagA subfamily outer membrane receptor
MKARTLLLILIAVVATGNAMGQKRGKLVTVTGTITDTAMVPVSGVLLVVDGESTGITTNRNGIYKLKIKPDVKSIGAFTNNMGSVATVWDGRSVVDLVLDGRTGLLNFTPEIPAGERRIDVGYGTKRRKDLTTDVGFIDGQDEVNLSYTNIYDMIQGKVPGVQVSGNKITIRGINSINMGTDPLFVVDGVVVNSIDNISPRQVKSISVLKGSDASIYGSRGAGGVILITLLGSER